METISQVTFISNHISDYISRVFTLSLLFQSIPS